LLGVAYKIFNVGRLGFFVRAQPKFCFGRQRHVLVNSSRKTLTHLSRKTLFSDTDRKENDSRCRPGKMADQGLKLKASPDDADRTFPSRQHQIIIQGSV